MLSGFLTGATLTAGILFLVATVIYRPQRLANRVLPHVSSRKITVRKRSLSSRISRSALNLLESVGSTRASVERRLATLGDGTLIGFRLHQLQWGMIGAAVGFVVALGLLNRGFPGALGLVLIAGGGLTGAIAADSRLTARVNQRSVAYTRQLPDLVELLALAVGSGEPIRVALERLATIGSGELVAETRRMLNDVKAGESLSAAMTAMGARSQNRNVGRFTDAVVASIEQGSGLATTLHTQARDSRDAARRELLEKGGRAEIAMMVPVVFLIMPVTILFTLYPGIKALTFTP